MAEPTGSIIRMPKVENALGQSTTSAASQKAVTDGINQAKSAASTADSKAVAAQTTANEAKTAASTADGKAVAAQTTANKAQTTANEAKTTASAAQTAATNANNNANGRVPTSRKINGKALTADISLTAADVGALTKAQADGYYQPKGQAGGVTFGAVETMRGKSYREYTHGGRAVERAFEVKIPNNAVLTKITSIDNQNLTFEYRRITGGV